MNDFLKKLRSSQQKGSGNQRENHSGHFYQNRDKRKRTPDRQYESRDDLSKNINEILPLITENCSSFISSIDQYIEANDQVTKTKIKMNEAISTFFTNLNLLLFGDNPPAFKGTPMTPHAITSYAVGTRYTKGEIIAMIKSMRKEGATFSIIAEYLKDKGIPTFSGRGDWHAQTIHRLCK